jgi:hypothetical protein
MLAKLQHVYYSLIAAQRGFGSSLPLPSGLHLTNGRKHEQIQRIIKDKNKSKSTGSNQTIAG